MNYILFMFYIIIGILKPYPASKEIIEAKEFWWNGGQESLKNALNRHLNKRVAKNIIIFIGDGMSSATLTAARIMKGQEKGNNGEEAFLEFEKFPYCGFTKTYNVDHQVSDSASTATAIFSGVKIRHNVLGLDGSVFVNNCSSVKKVNYLPNIAHWALKEGKDVGFVTTTRVTHATPAALYAHSPSRFWEYDIIVPKTCQNISKDIAKQLVEDYPGNHFKVILGGGRLYFHNKSYHEANETGKRRSEDLITRWTNIKEDMKVQYKYITKASELEAINAESTDYLLGLFSPEHMSYESLRNPLREPSLSDMVKKAIEILRKSSKGFLLVVEGGRIDQAHHAGKALLALKETLEFDRGVLTALKMTKEADTLLVVTADHSHTLVISGYAARGNPIGGKSSFLSDVDKLPFTTLLYGNGPGYKIIGGKRENISTINTEEIDYRQHAAVPLRVETHAGDDVAIYAQGPMAHLFSGLHEQNYIAHVIAYAACIDKKKLHCIAYQTNKTFQTTYSLLHLFCVLFLYFLNNTLLWPSSLLIFSHY